MWRWSLLRGGGRVCISLDGKNPKIVWIITKNIFFWKMKIRNSILGGRTLQPKQGRQTCSSFHYGHRHNCLIGNTFRLPKPPCLDLDYTNLGPYLKWTQISKQILIYWLDGIYLFSFFIICEFGNWTRQQLSQMLCQKLRASTICEQICAWTIWFHHLSISKFE